MLRALSEDWPIIVVWSFEIPLIPSASFEITSTWYTSDVAKPDITTTWLLTSWLYSAVVVLYSP